MFGAVAVGIAQVLPAANGLRHQRLYTVQRPTGSEVHGRAMRQIGRGAVDKIVRVINQVYGERIRRGGVGCHFFDDLQLAGGVCQIGRTGMACAHGVVGVVGLDADVVAVCNNIERTYPLAKCNDFYRGILFIRVTVSICGKKCYCLRGITGSIPFFCDTSQVPMDIARLGFGGGVDVADCRGIRMLFL